MSILFYLYLTQRLNYILEWYVRVSCHLLENVAKMSHNSNHKENGGATFTNDSWGWWESMATNVICTKFHSGGIKG